MHYKQIIRTGPDGKAQRPWRTREHQFVLGDPAMGAVKHRDDAAVKVDNYGEALELVERGFSIRMSDGRGPPSLVSPGGLQLVDEPVQSLDELWTYTVPAPPFSLEDVLLDLRQALLAEALMIRNIAGDEAAAAFAGTSLGDGAWLLEGDGDSSVLDLDRFNITRVIRDAYSYAFVPGPEPRISDEDVDELEMYLERVSAKRTNRCHNPLNHERSPIRVTAEMAYARWQLREEFGLTVSAMAFLARMTEAAARNSLSKLSIKTEGGRVPHDVAIRWLEVRRDFLPLAEWERPCSRWTWQLVSQLREQPSEEGLHRLLEMHGRPSATRENAAAAVLAALRQHRLPTVAELRVLARALECNVDGFVTEALSAWIAEIAPADEQR